MAVKIGETGGISIIDFGAFLDGTQKQAVADEILQSFKKIGFVYLINHGIPRDKIDVMFEWSKRFFALPMEKKMLAPHPPSGAHHRGYSAPGIEKVIHYDTDYDDDGSKDHRVVPDVKESFESGSEQNKAMPNIWLPDHILPGFREACLDYYWTCRETQLNVLRSLAIAFHLPEDYFLKYHEAAENQLRLLHYPSVPVQQLKNEEISRIGAHSDFCSLTLLVQDMVGGLEVEDPNEPGRFNSATPIEGAVVVNIGDFLMRWSNDTVRSTIHRVRAPPGMTSIDGMTPERYSIPYFCAADLDTVVDCIPGTFSEEQPKKYEPTSAREYIMTRLAANY